jgi:transcriptional/translational regulatory protein YebC/TACO1
MKLMNALDDHDDVQRVWANFEIEDQEMEKLLAAL